MSAYPGGCKQEQRWGAFVFGASRSSVSTREKEQVAGRYGATVRVRGNNRAGNC